MTTEWSVLCPGCGYDLRAATEDRCSECGLAVDRASLEHSEIPWAHRRQIGRVRAFFKTVWMITSDVRSLRHEAAKPQSPSDAAAFRWWVVTFLVLGVGVVIGAIHTTRTRSTVLRQFWSEVGAEELLRVALGLT